MFLEFWKRKQAEIQYDWDVADFELEEVTLVLQCFEATSLCANAHLYVTSFAASAGEIYWLQHIRPDFEIRCKKRKLNPVTQMMEPFLPFYSKASRRCSSIAVVFFMVSVYSVTPLLLHRRRPLHGKRLQRHAAAHPSPSSSSW